jgi:Flp pilus assembly protein TadG
MAGKRVDNMDVIKQHAKTFATFLVTIVVNIVISLLQGEQPWPQTQEEWIRYVATSFAAALTTYGVGNQITQKQLNKAKSEGVVVGDAVVVPKPEREPVVVAVAPTPAPVVTETPSIVDQIIADKQRRP